MSGITMNCPRRIGVLPVREHLRPRPDQRDAHPCWAATRDADGRLCFAVVRLEEAEALTVEGEA